MEIEKTASTLGQGRLELLELSCGYASRPVFQELNLKVEPGCVTALMGPNGSGKSTIINCVCGNLRPWTGRILIGERDITDSGPRIRSRLVAVVPQLHEPCFPFSCQDFIALGRAPHIGLFSHPGKADLLRAGEAAELLGIGGLLHRPCSCLSGGETRLMLIARALVQDTPVLILDEPDNHLDFSNQALVLERVRDLARQRGLAVLMSVHNPNLVSLYCDRVHALNHSGDTVARGTVEKVMRSDVIARIYSMKVKTLTDGKIRVFCPLTGEKGRVSA